MSTKAKRDKNASRMRKTYYTDEGQAYEHKRRTYPRSRFMRAKNGAIKRDLEWSISFEDYVPFLDKKCDYCNRPIKHETGSGLDRIDNDFGYHLDNVAPCCGDCNRRRHLSMSAEEFKEQSKLNGYWVPDES